MREKREHQRKPLELEVECRTADGVAFPGRSRDLSVGGMYIVAPTQPPFGSPVTVTLTLPTGALLALPGTARWSKPDGFGVQFGLMGAKETHTIARLVGVGRAAMGSSAGVESERLPPSKTGPGSSKA